jgi:hypothetical protein
MSRERGWPVRIIVKNVVFRPATPENEKKEIPFKTR